MATRRDPSPSGVFINDLHKPSTHILEGPIQTHRNAQLAPGGSNPNAKPAPRGFDPDAKLAPGGFDLDAKPALRGFDHSASMTTSPADVVVLALDQTNWQVPLLAYLLKEVLPPERTEARRITRRAKTFIAIGDELYK